MSLSRSLDYFCFLSFCCPCLNLLLFSGPLFTRLSSAWVVLSDSASHRGVVVFYSVLSNWKRKFLLLQHFFNEPDLKGPLRLHGFFEAAEKKSRTKSWTPESWAVIQNECGIVSADVTLAPHLWWWPWHWCLDKETCAGLLFIPLLKPFFFSLWRETFRLLFPPALTTPNSLYSCLNQKSLWCFNSCRKRFWFYVAPKRETASLCW